MDKEAERTYGAEEGRKVLEHRRTLSSWEEEGKKREWGRAQRELGQNMFYGWMECHKEALPLHVVSTR